MNYTLDDGMITKNVMSSDGGAVSLKSDSSTCNDGGDDNTIIIEEEEEDGSFEKDENSVKLFNSFREKLLKGDYDFNLSTSPNISSSSNNGSTYFRNINNSNNNLNNKQGLEDDFENRNINNDNDDISGYNLDKESEEYVPQYVNQRITVNVRLRPAKKGAKCSLIEPNPVEKRIIIKPFQENQNIGTSNPTFRSYRFDHVFPPNSSQSVVYNTMAKPLMRDLCRGINTCIIAYGQTGAGKTYTLSELGSETISSSSPNKMVRYLSNKMPTTPTITLDGMAGILPRSIHDLFEFLKMDGDVFQYTVKVSFMQIYMEVIQDLLRPENNNLQIREDKNRIYVEGLTEHKVRHLYDVLLLLDFGDRTRTKACTKVNAQSSRSHTIFVMSVEKIHKITGSKITSKFICCDLAGSERAHKNQVTGKLLEEARFINLSLSSLGNVIAALANSDYNNTSSNNYRNTYHPVHIPWRDSKLTRILQDTLSGRSRISLIINISPEDSCYHETVTSLTFGQRAMNVTIRPQVNEEINYKSLALELQGKLDSLENNKGREMADILAQNEEMTSKITTITNELALAQNSVVKLVSENEKIASLLKQALQEKNHLQHCLKKAETRANQLDKIVGILSSSENITTQQQKDVSKLHSLFASDRSNHFANTQISQQDDIQDFIFNEREALRKQILEEQEQKNNLSQKLEKLEQSTASLNNTLSMLKTESEEQQKEANNTKMQIQKQSDIIHRMYLYLERIEQIISILHKYDILQLQNSKASGFSFNSFGKNSSISNVISTESIASRDKLDMVADADIVELAFVELIGQIAEREKMIEVLCQTINMTSLENKYLSYSDHVYDVARSKSCETPSLQSSPSSAMTCISWKNNIRKFQRWDSLRDAFNRIREDSPMDSSINTSFTPNLLQMLNGSVSFLNNLQDASGTTSFDQTTFNDEAKTCLSNSDTNSNSFSNNIRMLNRRYKHLQNQMDTLSNYTTIQNEKHKAMVEITDEYKKENIKLQRDLRRIKEENKMLQRELLTIRNMKPEETSVIESEKGKETLSPSRHPTPQSKPTRATPPRHSISPANLNLNGVA